MALVPSPITQFGKKEFLCHFAEWWEDRDIQRSHGTCEYVVIIRINVIECCLPPIVV